MILKGITHAPVCCGGQKSLRQLLQMSHIFILFNGSIGEGERTLFCLGTKNSSAWVKEEPEALSHSCA